MSSKPCFIVGVVGFIILGLMVKVMDYIPSSAPAPYELFLWLVFVVGAVLSAFTFLGFNRKYGSRWGLATFIISLILVWVVPVQRIFIVDPTLSLMFEMLGLILLAVVFILWGATMIFVRTSTTQPLPYLIAGALFLLSANYYLVGDFLFAACMMSVIALISAELTKPPA